MIIHLATDHAGFEYKEQIKSWLLGEGLQVVDHGAFIFDEVDDYPDFISKAAARISKNPETDKAVIFGGSGQGEAMVANRFPGVRAAVLNVDNEDLVLLSRQHNDANILSIGARFLTIDSVKKHIWTWLHTEAFTEDKYTRRNQKVEKITKEIHS